MKIAQITSNINSSSIVAEHNGPSTNYDDILIKKFKGASLVRQIGIVSTTSEIRKFALDILRALPNECEPED